MEKVLTGAEPQSNVFRSKIVSISGSITKPAVKIKVASVIRDDSLDMNSTPPDNGRFEKGWVHIGELNAPDGTFTSKIDGNGRRFFKKTGGFNVRFSAESNPLYGYVSRIKGKLSKLKKNGKVVFKITSQSPPVSDWSVFKDGTFTVGGTGGNINWLRPNIGNVSGLSGNIPIVAHICGF